MKCGVGGTAMLRESLCTVTRGTRAPWDVPRRGGCSPHVCKSAKQEGDHVPKAPLASTKVAAAAMGRALTSLPGSRGSIERSLPETWP